MNHARPRTRPAHCAPGYGPMGVTGQSADGEESHQQVASGAQTKSEARGFGDSEFAP
ncbi:MAG: hypothetical protein ABIS50_23495 [Luteolibacter sp.]|uniref:hypothetical protein n=1 Tax=Luteolibacter sp. TaxID=1962973 RepID=UPI003265E015